MKVTKLSSQVKNPDRINVFIDDKYTFSLDISQITDLRVKVGQELNQEEVDQLKKEGYEIGDLFGVTGSTQQFEIIGFSKKTTYQTAPVIYMNLDTWQTYRYGSTF